MQSANYSSPLTIQGNSSGEAVPVTGPTGASSTTVQGAVAGEEATVGNPVGVGAVYNSSPPSYTTGDRTDLQAGQRGSLRVEVFGGGSTASLGNSSGLLVQGAVASGAAVGGNPVLNGAAYTGNAAQPAVTTGQTVNLQADPAGNLRTAPQRPTAADIVTGYLQHTATTGAATLLTVAAGRTWVGTVTVSVAASKAAAATGNGLVSALIATAGTGVAPAAGTVFAVSARIGANAASGLSGTQGANFGSIPMTIVAPAGNAVTLTLASTLTSTTEGAVDACAFGVQQ